jgi:hypothetical protein
MDPTFASCLASFRRVVERSRAEDDRIGLFATLYSSVTAGVERRCAEGGFAEAARMERFVCAFAHRYFVAHDAWRDHRPVVRSWAMTFDAATRWRPVVLQHLLLGMNAHINLDLGIVTAEMAGSAERLPLLRPDFEAVNDVLGSMVEDCLRALGSASPWFGLADRMGARHDEAVIRFSLRRARAQAWSLAERLVVLPVGEWPSEIDRTDRAVARIGHRILHPGAALSAALMVVRLREPWRAGHAIDAIERQEPGPS